MFGAQRRPVKGEQAAALEDAIDDRQREVLVMEDAAPCGEWLIGGEDHRSPAFVTVVDDVEEHIRGIGPVGQVPYLVDDE